MAKRHLSKQQQLRIEQKALGETNAGLLINRFGKQANIEDEQGHIIRCSLRQHLGSLVAGDRVLWKNIDKKHGVIVARIPRETVLGRPDKSGKIKAIAANIDQLLIVVAVKPAFSQQLLDSYLVISEHLDIPAKILVNKSDLPNQALLDTLRPYQELGYEVIPVSAQSNQSLKPLLHALHNKTSVFVGQSGVGKSSLLNGLIPHAKATIGAISQQSELGRHTTSMSQLYHLDLAHGQIIDSPGIREFGLWHMPNHEIASGFIEFRNLLGHCKFRDCQHKEETGCAIRHAVKTGTISSDRYRSFLNLLS